MRFLILLSVLLTSALASSNTFSGFLDQLYGNCGGACFSTEFKDSSANCGDPSSSASTTCYCQNYLNVFENIDTERLGKCVMKCNIDIGQLNYQKLSQQLGKLCGSSLGTAGTGSSTGATPSNAASPSAGGASPSAGGASPSAGGASPSAGGAGSSTSHTGAASTIASSKIALALGALAFLAYAL